MLLLWLAFSWSLPLRRAWKAEETMAAATFSHTNGEIERAIDRWADSGFCFVFNNAARHLLESATRAMTRCRSRSSPAADRNVIVIADRSSTSTVVLDSGPGESSQQHSTGQRRVLEGSKAPWEHRLGRHDNKGSGRAVFGDDDRVKSNVPEQPYHRVGPFFFWESVCPRANSSSSSSSSSSQCDFDNRH